MNGGCARCGAQSEKPLVSYLFYAPVPVMFARLPQAGSLAVCEKCAPTDKEKP